MKRLILMAAVLLTVSLAHPAMAGSSAAAHKVIPCSGFLAGNETSQFQGGKIILNGTANGTSSMGDFTYTYREELDPDRLTAVESGQLTFTEGETVQIEGFGIAENSGLTKDAGTLASMTVLLHFTNGSGRFAGDVGSLIVQRTQNIVAANYAGQTDISGSFKGYYVARAPGSGEEVAAFSSSAEPNDSVVLVCDNGRERVVPGFSLYRYLDRHPGSYVGHCAEINELSR